MDFSSPIVHIGEKEEDCLVDQEELDHASLESYVTPLPPAPPSAPVPQNNSIMASLGRRLRSFSGSVSASSASPLTPAAAAPPRPAAPKKKKGRVYRHQMNTNVVAIKLSALADKDCVLATGDPIFCGGCKATFNSESSLSDSQVWACEFCGRANQIDIDEEEKPTSSSVNYVLEAAPSLKANVPQSSQDTSALIFVVDVSGSMCVTQEVQGHFVLKGARRRTDEFEELFEAGDMRMPAPGRRQRNTWVSRLQAVQAAIDTQLEALAKEHPNRKVAIITFANDVRIIGDGSMEEVVVTGDKLKNYAVLANIGETCSLPGDIRNSQAQLTEKLFDLEEGGQTALGPAMTIATHLAAQTRGSQVILCTDGLANVGLGALDEQQRAAVEPPGGAVEENDDDATAFYQRIGVHARDAGVTVNVISIADADCRLESLGHVCDLTGGDVQRINPLELAQNFSGMLEKTVIATNCQAEMLLHRGLRFCDDEEDEEEQGDDSVQRPAVAAPPANAMKASASPSLNVVVTPPPEQAVSASASASTSTPDDESKEKMQEDKEQKEDCKENDAHVTRRTTEIGNVTVDSEIFFEYAVAKDYKKHFAHLKSIPFQVKIYYTQADGAKCVRVITKHQVVSQEAARSEDLNFGLLACNAEQKSARYLQKGLYQKSRVLNRAHASMFASRASTPQQQQATAVFCNRLSGLDKMVHLEQQQELVSGKSAPKFGMSKNGRQKLMKHRAEKRGDGLSAQMYQTKKSSSASYF